jgi:hypothetical protein
VTTQLTQPPINLPDCFKWFKDLPQQNEAIAWLDSQLTEAQRTGLAQRFRAKPKTQKPPTQAMLSMTWTGKYHATGFRIFRLAVVQDDATLDQIPVLSGAACTQYESFVHPAEDYSGSLRCLPEGIYSVGIVEDSRSEGLNSWGEGLGRWAIALNVIAKHQVNNRSAFYIHDDANRSYSMGSAGCICPFESEDLGKILTWMEVYNPLELICDLGTGLL